MIYKNIKRFKYYIVAQLLYLQSENITLKV